MISRRRFLQYADRAAFTGATLNPWQQGPAVKELQELLCAHGFKLKIDGDFGSITESAVRAVQLQYGLRADGIVGSKTWCVLKTEVQPGNRCLRRGHSGADVFELQGLLQIHGYQVERNGILSEETEQAVQAFQLRQRLVADGKVNSTTWTVLRAGVPLPPVPQQKRWFLELRKWW